MVPSLCVTPNLKLERSNQVIWRFFVDVKVRENGIFFFFEKKRELVGPEFGIGHLVLMSLDGLEGRT